MNIRATRWLPNRDRRKDLGEGIGRSRSSFVRFGVKIGKYLHRDGLKREGWMENKDGRERGRPGVLTRRVRL